MHTSVDVVWVLTTGALVFFMQAGFAMVEAGFVRSKEAGNVLMKNLMDFALGAVAFYIIGYGLLMGEDKFGIIGWSNFAPFWKFDTAGQWHYVLWFFEAVFAATAATIVSGGISGRTKFKAYLVYSFFVSLIIYPISAHWVWGNGWLSKLDIFKGNSISGYIDFAGSSVVHMVGGFLALIGAAMVGPRRGKFVDGKPRVIPGHNLPLSALGTFILWFGWYGFNAGSTLSASDPKLPLVIINTTLGGAAGALGALITVWIFMKVPDIALTFNGALIGLVAITAGCYNMSPGASILVGLIAGIMVVPTVSFVEHILRVDDPVGAFAVHGVGGLWGIIAVGLFDLNRGLLTGNGFEGLLIQLIGAGAIIAWALVTGTILFSVIKATIGLRVAGHEEKMGLDLSEHGADSYPEFQKGFLESEELGAIKKLEELYENYKSRIKNL